MKKKIYCILLVDDDPGTNLINNKIIDNAGAAERVIVKRNGEEALDFVIGEVRGTEESAVKDGLIPGGREANGVEGAARGVIGNEVGLESGAGTERTLILLDINMPLMDGWEFLDAFEKLPVSRKDDYRIVMLTTSFHPDDKIRAEKHPAVMDYLIKPLTPLKLEGLHKQFME